MNPKRIIRVFPTQTSQTPLDDYTFFDGPDHLWIPEHDEVHISCVFTWDKSKAESLAEAWSGKCPVKLGGPAYDDPGGYLFQGCIQSLALSIRAEDAPTIANFALYRNAKGSFAKYLLARGTRFKTTIF